MRTEYEISAKILKLKSKIKKFKAELKKIMNLPDLRNDRDEEIINHPSIEVLKHNIKLYKKRIKTLNWVLDEEGSNVEISGARNTSNDEMEFYDPATKWTPYN